MSKGTEYRWKWDCKHGAEEVWMLFETISDKVVSRCIPAPALPGKKRRLGPASTLFSGPVLTDSSTLEWVHGSSMHSIQKFQSGMLSECECNISVIPREKGCQVQYHLRLVPSSPFASLLIPFLVGYSERKNIEGILRELDKDLSGLAAQVNANNNHIPRTAEAFVANVKQSLAERGFDLNWIGKLIRMIASEPDKIIGSIRAPQVAAQWGAPPAKILSMLLHATDLKLLEMRWIITCKSCGTGELSLTSLSELTKDQVCGACSEPLTYNANDNIELIFMPHSNVRKLNAKITRKYGRNGEGKIVIQKQVPPNAMEDASIKLTPGLYRLRTEDAKPTEWAEFSVEEEGQGELFTQPSATGLEIIQRQDAPAPSVRFSNNTSELLKFYLEDISWKRQRVLAVDAFTDQTFRNLYPLEGPPTDLVFQCEDVTLLFSRLCNFNEQNDLRALAILRELLSVQRQMIARHDGCVVKLIGDAVVAAFHDPALAVQAALEMQSDFDTFAASLPPESGRLAIRMALHSGPAILVSMNHVCDFFGATLRTTWAARDVCPCGDLLISNRLADLPQIKQVLEEAGKMPCNFDTKVDDTEGVRFYRVAAAVADDEDNGSLFDKADEETAGAGF